MPDGSVGSQCSGACTENREVGTQVTERADRIADHSVRGAASANGVAATLWRRLLLHAELDPLRVASERAQEAVI